MSRYYNDLLIHSEDYYEDELYHYGVKGMRWGVRKEHHREYREKATAADKNIIRRARSKMNMVRYFKTGAGLKVKQKYTEEWYDNLSTGKEYIQKGATLNRITRGVDGDILKGNMYVAQLKSDSEMYKATIPVIQRGKALQDMGAKKYHTVYQVQMKTKRRLSMPSEKERIDTFIETLQTPGGAEWLKQNGYKKEINEYNAKKVGLAYYKTFNKYAGNQAVQFNTQYFDTLKKKGYDALIDDNDAGVWSKKPTIILGGTGKVKITHVHQLSSDEINQAQANVLEYRQYNRGGTNKR